MAIVETMKVYPEITLDKFLDEARRRVRVWSHDHFHPCNGAMGNALRNIEALGFIKRCIKDDESETLLSDFDNKKCTGEVILDSETAETFRALERAELDATSSLQRLQAALNDTSIGVTTKILLSTDNFQLAARVTERSLNALKGAIETAYGTLCDFHAEKQGCKDALASWRTGLADFDTTSRLPIETIETALSGKSDTSVVMTPEVLRKAVAGLRVELVEFKTGLEACLDHINGCGGHRLPVVAADESSDSGTSGEGPMCDLPTDEGRQAEAPEEAAK
jgi:hypothetical protein